MKTTIISPSLSMTSVRRLGYRLVAGVFLFIFVWGGLAQISGAVVAPGRVSVESSVKRIQHKEGGIVQAILVQEGDRVVKGQPLVRLDSTVINANNSVVSGQLLQFRARKWRLEAERDSKPVMTVPAEFTKNSEYQPFIKAERKLMASRRSLRDQKKTQLKEQIHQNGQQIVGIEAQIAAQSKQYDLISKELIIYRELLAKDYMPLPRVNQFERESESLKGAVAELKSNIARLRSQTTAIGQQMLQIDSEGYIEVMNELNETETKLGQLEQQRITTMDAKERVEVKSPVDGTVQQMKIHTTGGVVSSGETMMIVVPDDEELVVEARIDPRNIDQVGKGSVAHVRFTAFDVQSTPEARGSVDSISSDVEVDEKSGSSFYRARLLLKTMDMPQNLRERMVSGMPVEVQIQTQRRNALSYFLKPLSDQMNRTFKEG